MYQFTYACFYYVCLDIDWEFPQNDKEAADYALLLSELRAALDQYGQQVQQADSPRLMLTVAVPCGPDNYRKLHLKDMEKYIDVFYLMAYDYSGDWDQQTGHQANLFGGPLNTDQAVNDYMAAGVPASKLVLGIPMYGRGFTNTNGPDCCYQGVCKGSWEAGQYDYKCLPLPGSTEHNDMEKMASWCYDPQSRVFVTYDSPQVVNGKCEYIKQKELAGAMFWELSADRKYDDPNSLINVVYNAFEGQVDQTPNHLDFPLSEYINIKNQMQQ